MEDRKVACFGCARLGCLSQKRRRGRGQNQFLRVARTQAQARRAEELARRAALERAVEGVQTRLDLKLTEERANLQATQARSGAGLACSQCRVSGFRVTTACPDE